VASARLDGTDPASPLQGALRDAAAPPETPPAGPARADSRPQRPQPWPGLPAVAPPATATTTPAVSGALAALEGLERLRGRESTADALAAVSAAQQAPAAALQGPVAGPPEAAAPPSPANVPTVVQPVPVDAPEFPGAFAGQVESLLLEGVDSARILVTPREMGPIRIELSLSGETATVAFSAAQPETRQAIEQTLPALRTLLSEHGLELAHASVDQGYGGQPQQREAPARSAVDAPPTARRPEPTGGAETRAPRGPAAGQSRLVDLFA
jgi:flagellar hook-length control protein FliK